MNSPKSKEAMFALTQVECDITRKILMSYIKGLEQMLAENAKTINQHEELLGFQQEEIQMLRHEIDSLEYSLRDERCL